MLWSWYIVVGRASLPVARQEGQGIDYHDTDESRKYRSPDRNVGDRIPSDHIHRQMYINQNHDCKNPKISQGRTTDGAIPVSNQRYEEGSYALPQRVQYRDPE